MFKMCLLIAVTTASLWSFWYPLRWLGWPEYTVWRALRASSVVVVALLRYMLLETSSKVFHSVLKSCDASLAADIKAMPVINGLRRQARNLAKILALIFVVLSICAPIIGHALLPIAVAIGAVALPHWLLITPVVLVAIVLLVLAGWGYACLSPFLWLSSKLDPIVGIIAAVYAALGLVSGASIGEFLELSYYVTMLGQQFLANYSQRLETAKWTAFTEKYRWRMCGFGLPAFILVHYKPEAAMLLLPAFHGSAGCLLADILQGNKPA